MKKNRYIILIFIFLLVFNCTAYADEDATGYITIQGYVEDEIRDNEYSCYVLLWNYDTGKQYEVYLYAINDYKTTVELPAGKYYMDSATVVGDTTAKYPSKLKDAHTEHVKNAVDFELMAGGVHEMHIAFGDTTFDNIIRDSETEAPAETETTPAEITSAEAPTTEAPTETTAPAGTDPVEEPAKGSSPVTAIISVIVLVAVAAAYVWIKIKNKKK